MTDGEPRRSSVMLERLPTPSVRRAAWLAALVGALVYANSLGNGFAYDDVHVVQNNPPIRSLATLPAALLAPYWPVAEGQDLALWRPVTTALLGVQYALGGGGPLLYHVTNVALHALASALVVLLLASLMSASAASVAGLVFAVHPVHTEAVANVVGVAELFSGAAILLACLVHVRAGERSGWGSASLVAVLYLLAFGAKESAATLPGLVFLLDAARGRLAWRDLPGYLAARWRAYLLMLLVAIGLLTMRLDVLGGTFAPMAPGGAYLLQEIPRIWTLGEIWLNYVRLWVFPLDLASDYTPNVIRVSLGWHLPNATGAALTLAILVGALAAWRRSPLEPGSKSARMAAFGVLWFGIALSPVSNTLFLSGVLLAERTLYLPTVGLAAATGWLALRAYRSRPAIAAWVLAGCLALGAARTWTRNPTWESTETAFFTLMADYPHSGRSQWLLADSYMQLNRTSEALRAYRAAADLLDSSYPLLTHVARTLIELERFEAADGLLDIAMRDRPEEPAAYRMRAGLRAEIGDAAGAERFVLAALDLTRRDPAREHILAWALASRGALDEAAEVRRRAQELAVARLWQGFVQDAYEARHRGDTTGVRLALDSAYAAVRSRAGRRALDSISARDFGRAAR